MIRAFEVVLALNLTGLFSFMAIELGLPIAVMSGVILAFLLFFLLLNYGSTVWLLQKKDVLLWVLLVLIWPALTVLYSEAADLRGNALNLYLVALMLATAIWRSKVSRQRAHRVIVVSVAIAVFGLLLSLLKNDYFQDVAAAAEARYSYSGRAFGFFLQPNMAADALNFLYALMLLIVIGYTAKTRYLISSVYLFLILLTGSRGGTIVAAMIIGYVHIFSSVSEHHRFRSLIGRSAALIVIVLVFFSAIEAAKITSGKIGESGAEETGLTSRISAISSLDIEAGGLGVTAAARLLALKEHVEGISQRPMTGFGIGASARHSTTGKLTYTAHNQYVQIAYDFGLPALLLFMLVLFRMWRAARMANLADAIRCNPQMVLLIALSTACLFSTSIMYSRVFFAVLGALFAMRYATGPAERRIRS